MFGLQEIGVLLDSRECVVLTARRKGEIEETRTPSLAQVRGPGLRAVGQRAYRLVGRSKDVVSVFPGRVDDPILFSGFLEQVLPPASIFLRRRIWASLPTAASLQMQLSLKSCFESSLGARESVLVPELLSAALGAGVPVLRAEEDSQRARMLVHLGSTRMAAGVFVDGGLTGLVVREASWDQLVREVQENLQFRLGTPLGFNTFHKVVRTLSRSFFERHAPNGARPPARPGAPDDAPVPVEPGPAEIEPAELLSEVSPPANLRSFNERGLIEYVVEDEMISRAIDVQIKSLLFSLEKIVFGCFHQLRSAGRGEIASDLFADRILLCGDIYFDSAALARYFSRLTRFRFEAVNGNPVAKGLRRILSGDPAFKKTFRELADQIHEDERLHFSRI